MSYEFIGIVGSVLIIIAFTRKKEKEIRILDGIGAVCMVVYGLLTHTWATAFLNSVLILVHIKRFIEMTKEE